MVFCCALQADVVAVFCRSLVPMARAVAPSTSPMTGRMGLTAPLKSNPTLSPPLPTRRVKNPGECLLKTFLSILAYHLLIMPASHKLCSPGGATIQTTKFMA